MSEKACLLQIDPTLPKDWRWQTAKDLVDNGLPATKKNCPDRWVTQATKYLYKHRKSLDNALTTNILIRNRKSNLSRQYPYLSIAHSIYDSDSRVRWAIEALLVCGTEFQKISDMCHTVEPVVLAYQKIFFDVADRLESKIYVISEVLGEGSLENLNPADSDSYWKTIAYYCGAEALESLWSIGPLDEVQEQTICELIKSQAMKNALKAVTSRSINGYTAEQIMKEYTDVRRLDMEEKNASKNVDGDLNHAINTLLMGSMKLADGIEASAKLSIPRDKAYLEAKEKLKLPEIKVAEL